MEELWQFVGNIKARKKNCELGEYWSRGRTGEVMGEWPKEWGGREEMLTAWIKISQIRKAQRILESSIYICTADLCLTTELLCSFFPFSWSFLEFWLQCAGLRDLNAQTWGLCLIKPSMSRAHRMPLMILHERCGLCVGEEFQLLGWLFAT